MNTKSRLLRERTTKIFLNVWFSRRLSLYCESVDLKVASVEIGFSLVARPHTNGPSAWPLPAPLCPDSLNEITV